jgi:nitrogenase subunit NifH
MENNIELIKIKYNKPNFIIGNPNNIIKELINHISNFEKEMNTKLIELIKRIEKLEKEENNDTELGEK